MSDELKPCPFCGESAELTKGGRVCCPAGDDCPAGFMFASPDDWNRRAIHADQVLVPAELLRRLAHIAQIENQPEGDEAEALLLAR